MNFTTAELRFTFDANMLVYYADIDAGERHEQARDLLDRAQHHNCILTLQSLGEFYHAVTRKRLLDPDVADAHVQDWLEVFETVSASPATITKAMYLARKHKQSFWDAMFCVTANQAGCSAIISEDQQYSIFMNGTEIIHPFVEGATAKLAPYFKPFGWH